MAALCPLYPGLQETTVPLFSLEQTDVMTRQCAEKERAGAHEPVLRVVAKPSVNKPRETNNCAGQKEQKAEDVTGSHYECVEFLHLYLQELSRRRNLACTRVNPLKIVRAWIIIQDSKGRMVVCPYDGPIFITSFAPVQYNRPLQGRLELARLESAENPDRTAIDKKIQEISQGQASLMRAEINARLDVRSLLTKEQREKLLNLAGNRAANNPMPMRPGQMRTSPGQSPTAPPKPPGE